MGGSEFVSQPSETHEPRRLTRSLFTFCLLAALIPTIEAGSQEPAKEYDLTWKLPHDRAAVYDVFDATKGVKQGEFWLLGCELDGKVAATQTSELPLRYVFKAARLKAKPGGMWQFKESAFAESGMGLGVAPLEVSCTYRPSKPKRVKLSDLLKIGTRGRKDRFETTDLVIVDAQCEFYRASVARGALIAQEKSPSATLSLQVALRVSDGVVLGARYQWSGRAQSYRTISGEPPVQVLQSSEELVLREPQVELTWKGLKESIDIAVSKGVSWLKSKQSKDGWFSDLGGYEGKSRSGIGSTALCILALIHSGLKVDDPALRNGLAFLVGKKSDETYDIALQLMALEAKCLPHDNVAGFHEFSDTEARDEIAKKITREEKEAAGTLAIELLSHQGQHGGFSYRDGNIGDFSNTLYAALGLKSAARLGARVPLAAWKGIVNFVLLSGQATGKEVDLHLELVSGSKVESKVKERGWSYRSPSRGSVTTWDAEPTSTMTGAALVAITIAASELVSANEMSNEVGLKIEEARSSALAWIQSRFQVRAASPEGGWYSSSLLHSYLFGLERVGIINRVLTIGEHDWYLEGASFLLSSQRDDGRWEGPHSTALMDSAFALLFLKRAAIPVETGAIAPALEHKEPSDGQRKR